MGPSLNIALNKGLDTSGFNMVCYPGVSPFLFIGKNDFSFLKVKELLAMWRSICGCSIYGSGLGWRGRHKDAVMGNTTATFTKL